MIGLGARTRRTVFGLIAAMTLTLLAAAPAAADDFNTRAGGRFDAGRNVLLERLRFDVHTGNEKCAGDSDSPALVPESSSRSFCFQARGVAGVGAYDTELSFRYAVWVPVTGDAYEGALISAQNQGCLDVQERHTDDGTPLQTYGCNGTPAQAFRLDDGRLRALDRCVTAPDDPGPITIFRCDDNRDDQRWSVDGRGRLVADDGRCAKVTERVPVDRAPVRLTSCGGDDQRWFARSGYSADGHVKVVFIGTNELSCQIVRTGNELPPRRMSCATSSVRDFASSRDPGPVWSVTAATPPPPDAEKVVFLGDSVTAGFGYCGSEGGGNSDHISCGVNDSMANAWALGDNSLQDCQPVNPPTTVNDRCSNNNFRGAPWDAGPWADLPTSPKLAYSYVIAQRQQGDDAAIENWAMTGSTPTDWDPEGGAFGSQLRKLKNSYVVMTLGANPLLSEYLDIDFQFFRVRGACAASTKIINNTGRQVFEYAAPLDDDQHSGGKWGLLKCFEDRWDFHAQSRHLLNVYKTLLDRGNRVLVMGYPAVCPWSFGVWQPDANPFDGPAKGNRCDRQDLPSWSESPKRISQWQQARALGDRANGKLERLAAQAGRDANKPSAIRFASPDQGDWERHQAWHDQSYIFRNDTWIHPSVDGHRSMAGTVTSAMCSAWGHWCGSPPRW